MLLRVAPAILTDPGCSGCTRREVLTGLAATAAAALAGCAANTTLAPQPDAGVAPATCGSNLCLDLTEPAYQALATVDGSLVIATATDRILVIRASATELLALSDRCTHAGCDVAYDRVGKQLTCPCHGSRYALTGEVTRGPATRALAVYPAQLDAASQVVTITL
jgi:cytochrome b6-f complex iron-sulfur subunit